MTSSLQDTGCDIKVYSQCAPQSTERVVQLKAGVYQVVNCIATIHDLLQTVRTAFDGEINGLPLNAKVHLHLSLGAAQRLQPAVRPAQLRRVLRRRIRRLHALRLAEGGSRRRRWWRRRWTLRWRRRRRRHARRTAARVRASVDVVAALRGLILKSARPRGASAHWELVYFSCDL